MKNACIFQVKNSFQEPKKIQTANLLDIRIDAKKMELVMKDQQVKTFDFSVFSDEEIKQLLNATGKIKSRINQQFI